MNFAQRSRKHVLQLNTQKVSCCILEKKVFEMQANMRTLLEKAHSGFNYRNKVLREALFRNKKYNIVSFLFLSRVIVIYYTP